MNRQINLPELLSIDIKNYTLYPNGLDYTYDFVKGINLILGGNGMGNLHWRGDRQVLVLLLQQGSSGQQP